MSVENPSYNWHGTNIVSDIGWGDNGKGKMVDLLSQNADMTIRFNGGANAGHTVVNEQGEFPLHLIPAGIFNSKCIIASPVAVDPGILTSEMEDLDNKGVPITKDNLLVSLDAALVLDWHKNRDGLREVARGEGKIGTTKRGIGPFYADRTERVGLRVHNLYESDFEEKFMKEFVWQTRLARLMAGERLVSDLTQEDINQMSPYGWNQMVRVALDDSPYDAEKMLQELYVARDKLAPHVANVLPIIWQAHDEGQNILGETANGSLLDIDQGTYPYVTSSHPTVEGFGIATAIHADQINMVYGATRAYGARVGEGPFPTELTDETAEQIRAIGNEYGTTTGRPRRVGWFDAPLAYYGARITGAREMAVTKLDVLDDLSEIKICKGYNYGNKYYGVGKIPSVYPRFLNEATPVYETLPGWKELTSGARSFEDLPKNAQNYVNRIQELVGLDARFVSVGPHRNETIQMG